MLSDSQGGVGDGPRPVMGDGLVLVGALLYALVNLTEEHLLGAHPIGRLVLGPEREHQSQESSVRSLGGEHRCQPLAVKRTLDFNVVCAGTLPRVELLAMVGSSAALICAAQAAVLEHRDWARITLTWQARSHLSMTCSASCCCRAVACVAPAGAPAACQNVCFCRTLSVLLSC